MTATAHALATNSWCSGGPSSFDTTFRRPEGSAGSIVSWALNYVYPLPQWLDGLFGDQAQVSTFANQWNDASTHLQQTQASLTQALTSVEAMEGKSIRALRRATETLTTHATDAAEWTEATASALSLAYEITVAVREAVVGALAELANIISALFDLSNVSLNPFENWENLERLLDAADRYVDVVGNLIDRMFSAFEELMRLIQALGPLVDEALIEMRTLLSEIIDMHAGPLGWIVGGPLGFVLSDTVGGIASDALAPTPLVTEVDIDDLVAGYGGDTDAQRRAYTDALATRELGSLEAFVVGNGLTDEIGRVDRTAVDIKRVVAADGTEHWVVSLPSTQDWNSLKTILGEGEWQELLADYPATNDLHTNIALMLSDNPQVATQYQRGVYEAMRQAGIPDGAPVVYTGFSQGGIMAANLAADRSSAYSTIGIVTTGAPIDRFDIPDHVEVAAFGHEGDQVHKIDDYMDAAGRSAIASGVVKGDRLSVAVGSQLLQGNDGIDTVTLPDPTGLDEQGQVFSNHSSRGYAETVGMWEQQNPEAAQRLVDLLGGDVIDHHVYSFGE